MSDRISVLIVEDEALVRMDIVGQMEDEGFQIFEASNAGRLALRCGMPEMPALMVVSSLGASGMATGGPQ